MTMPPMLLSDVQSRQGHEESHGGVCSGALGVSSQRFCHAHRSGNSIRRRQRNDLGGTCPQVRIKRDHSWYNLEENGATAGSS